MTALISEVLQQLSGYETFYKLRQRKRSAAAQFTFERTVEALVCDLAVRELECQGGGLHLPISNQVLRKKSRYKGVALGKTLPDILKVMAAEEMAFVELEKGKARLKIIDDELNSASVGGVRTVVKAGEKLLTRLERFQICYDDIQEAEDEEVLILRGKKVGRDKAAEPIEYKDMPETERMREELRCINRTLQAANISCDRPDVNTRKRRLRRIFHNGDWEQGGRLYGGFWQEMSSEQREEHITIDGDGVVELDYGQMALRILYGIAGETPPPGDLYNLSAAGIPVECRAGVKKVMNALISASEPLKRVPKGARKTIPRRYSLATLQAAIEQVHPKISHLLGKGLYGQVWRIESDILMQVLLELADQGITALAIHDALIVADEHKEVARSVMAKIFKAHVGFEPVVQLG